MKTPSTMFSARCPKMFERTTALDHGQPTSFDADAIAARRMNEGQPVAETYVKGSGADRLLEKNFVTLSVIDMYRQSLEENRIEAYARPMQQDPLEENPF